MTSPKRQRIITNVKNRYVKAGKTMQREGQVRIPSGCAISGMFARDGSRLCGENIIKSIATMHDRSNGLGGGFAGYGIYPEYKD